MHESTGKTARIGCKWTDAENEELKQMASEKNMDIITIAKRMKRNGTGIKKQLKKLGIDFVPDELVGVAVASDSRVTDLATERQIRVLQDNNVAVEPGMTKARASQLISGLARPATPRQKCLLESLSIPFDPNLSLDRASSLIKSALEQKQKR